MKCGLQRNSRHQVLKGQCSRRGNEAHPCIFCNGIRLVILGGFNNPKSSNVTLLDLCAWSFSGAWSFLLTLPYLPRTIRPPVGNKDCRARIEWHLHSSHPSRDTRSQPRRPAALSLLP